MITKTCALRFKFTLKYSKLIYQLMNKCDFISSGLSGLHSATGAVAGEDLGWHGTPVTVIQVP